MLPGDRFKNWIGSLGDRFKLPVGEWLRDWLTNWIIKTLEDLEPEAVDIIRDTLIKVSDHPATPTQVKEVISKLTAGTKPVPVIIVALLAVVMFTPMLFSIVQPLASLLTYAEERVLHSSRMDPIQAITAWRRDPENFGSYIDDLRDLGWSEDRIEALKFVTLFYPAPADLVRWQAREVFEPNMISKYGLDDELGEIEREPFYKAGMTDEQITNYWRAHWEHASYMQMVELLHRGLITEQDFKDWFRLVEIPPFWREGLLQTAYTWPTRVDVRRWWDMRTIDEARLRELYEGMGYRGQNLEDYITWTKVYVDFSSWITRWQKGWVAEEDVRDWLRSVGVPEDRIEVFIQEKIEADSGAIVEDAKNLTKTEIYKAVKQGKISRSEAVDLLMDLNYTQARAELLLAINIPEDETDEVVEERKLSKADIKSALASRLITEAEARTKLSELRYSSANADLLIKIFNAANNPPEEETLRQASKADIVSGVKKGVITAEEGYLLLIDIGFSEDAANFILTVQAEESPFSPIDFTEFKELTSMYRKAIGREGAEMPEELKAAAAEVVRIAKEIADLEESIKREKAGLVDQEVLPEETTARLTELQVARNQAVAEQQRLKSEYDRLVAEWKHKFS